MRSFRLAILAALAAGLLPAAAAAANWQGITPGVTNEGDLRAKFGPPSTEGKIGGRPALVYWKDEAIPGTRQTQFFLRNDGIVADVVVFPSVALDREAVQGKYGHPVKKSFTDDFKDVWYFAGGITVFFGKEGAVEAISYGAPDKADAAPGKADAAAARGQAATPRTGTTVRMQPAAAPARPEKAP